MGQDHRVCSLLDPVHSPPPRYDVTTMRRSTNLIRVFLSILTLAALAQARQQAQTLTLREVANRYFADINRKVLDMVQDFPADKYDYRLTKDMRSFGEVIVHIMSGNVYAAKAGRGEKVNWDELDPKKYPTKADIVAAFQKSMGDAEAALKAIPEDQFAKSMRLWEGVTEHSAEHYGLLVAYYRANGIVPPETRKQQK